MSDKTVFTTDDPNVMDKWRADNARYQEWSERVEAWAAPWREKGYAPVTYKSGDRCWLAGLSGDEPPGPGWRRNTRNDYPRYWVPRRGSKIEKALSDEMRQIVVSGLGAFEGMPRQILDGLRLITHGVHVYGDRLYVEWSCDRDAVERTREYNGAIWRHVPLSEYYAAKEAHEAQEAAHSGSEAA
jgi:hypothetical protein